MTLTEHLRDFWHKHVISNDICDIEEVDIELPKNDFEPTEPIAAILPEEPKP